MSIGNNSQNMKGKHKMKKLILLLTVLAPMVIFGQNTFKYRIDATGGLKVGSNGTEIDSVKVDGDYIYFYSGENAWSNDTLTGLAGVSAKVDTLTTGNTLIVGKRSAYTTIQSAIDDASSGDVILIYPGDYIITETINVKDGVNLYFVSGAKVIVNTGSFPVFTMDSDTTEIIGGKIELNSTASLFDINLSKLNVNGIEVYSDENNNHKTLIDSSEVSLNSKYFNSNIIASGNSKVFAKIEKLVLTDTAKIYSLNEAELNLTIDETTHLNISGVEQVFGYKNGLIRAKGNSTINAKISDVQGSIWIMDGGVVNLYESVGTGYCYINVSDSSEINVYNSIFTFDSDDQTTGLHLFETQSGATATINIHGGKFEFTGASGIYETYGALAEIDGGFLNLYNTHLKDNGQNISSGYQQIIKLTESSFKAFNSILDTGDGLADYVIGVTAGTSDFYIELNSTKVVGEGIETSVLYVNNSPAPTDSDTIILAEFESLLKSSSNRMTYTSKTWSHIVIESLNFRESLSGVNLGYVYETVTAQENGTDGDTIVITINYVRQDVASLVKPVIVDPLYLYIRLPNDNTKGGFYAINYFSQYYSSSTSYSQYTFDQKYERGVSGDWTPPDDFTIESYNSTSIVIIGVNNAAVDVDVYIQGRNFESVASIELTTR